MGKSMKLIDSSKYAWYQTKLVNCDEATTARAIGHKTLAAVLRDIGLKKTHYELWEVDNGTYYVTDGKYPPTFASFSLSLANAL